MLTVKEGIIMRRDLAETITDRLIVCSGNLDKSAAVVQASADQEFFQEYRSSVGQLLGLFYCDIFLPVFRQYPDLVPESWKNASMSLEKALQLVRDAQDILNTLCLSVRDDTIGEHQEVADIENALVNAIAEAEAIQTTLVARIGIREGLGIR
jgi:hypothetical protein